MRHDGRGAASAQPACWDCLKARRDEKGKAEFRCLDCLTIDMVCQECMVRRHHSLPLHRIQVCTLHPIRVSLFTDKIGLRGGMKRCSGTALSRILVWSFSWTIKRNVPLLRSATLNSVFSMRRAFTTLIYTSVGALARIPTIFSSCVADSILRPWATGKSGRSRLSVTSSNFISLCLRPRVLYTTFTAQFRKLQTTRI